MLKEERSKIEESLPKERKEKEQTTTEFSMVYEDLDDEDEEDEIDKWVKYNKMKNLDDFPIIRHIYLKYNTALCSQASVERFFSYGRLIFGMRRGRLMDENFEKQAVMKANQKLNPKLFVKKDM